LCDDCEFWGQIKLDFELIEIFTGIHCTPTVLRQWFGNKLHFIAENNVIIVPFFEFQYGESKDSWSVKNSAKSKLEYLGFSIVNNALVIPEGLSFEPAKETTSGSISLSENSSLSEHNQPQSPHSGGNILSKVKVKDKGNIYNKEKDFFEILNKDLAEVIYQSNFEKTKELELMLHSENVFGEQFPVSIKKTLRRFLATLLYVYEDPEDFKQHLQAIINEKLSDDKKGLDRKEYIYTRIKNKAVELHNATR
jgi:hypothetical protein